MVPEGLNAFGTFVHAAESLPVSFFSLWEGQKWGFFPKDRTYRAFLHNKLLFLIAQRDLHYYLGQCAALQSLAKLTTPFLAFVHAWVFSLRIAHISLFVLLHKS